MMGRPPLLLRPISQAPAVTNAFDPMMSAASLNIGMSSLCDDTSVLKASVAEATVSRAADEKVDAASDATV